MELVIGILVIVGLLVLAVLGILSIGNHLTNITQELRSIHETLLQLLKK
jgi:hypothetical protein